MPSQTEVENLLGSLRRGFAGDDAGFIESYMSGQVNGEAAVKRWQDLNAKYGSEQVMAYGRLLSAARHAGVGGGGWDNPDLKAQYEYAMGVNQKVMGALREQQEADRVAGERRRVTNQLEQLFSKLNSPVQNPDGSFSDPLAKQLVASGTNVAEGQAAMRGISGPLGARAASVGAQTAVQPWLAQRQQLAGQVMQVMNQRDLALEDQRLQADQLGLAALAMDNAAKGQRWQALQDQAQAAFGFVGGVGGGIIGGYLGGPQGAAAGAQAGSSALGGLGGAAVSGGGPSLGSPNFTNTSGGNRWSGGRGNF